ncbi:MAG: hypothetical protein HY696_04455 [Deltaproteobacteria bacterium]|nr:hypothetical protein [Deltaproteobacteria bacterium]
MKTTPKTKRTKAAPRRSRKNGQANGHLVDRARGVISELLQKYGAKDWLTVASQQRSHLVREVRALGDEMITRISSTPIFAQREQLIHEARDHLDSILDKLNGWDLLSRAYHSAKETGSELLSFLNIPSQRELKKLQTRLHKIESRLATIRTDRGMQSPE